MVCEGLREASHLVSLDLRGNGIQAAGAAALCQVMSSGVALRSLTLEWNALGSDSGVEVLCSALCTNRSLSHLDLRNNKITADAAPALAQLLTHNSSLVHLDLRWNILKATGGRILSDALSQNTHLSEILLAGNQIPVDIVHQCGNVNDVLCMWVGG